MASPFDLVSLADLKSWLGITGTDDDVLLARLITQISRAIFNVIDRPAILPSAYTETYDGGNDVSIMLRQWPVIGISSCIVDGVTIPPSPPLVAGAISRCHPARGYAEVVAARVCFHMRHPERHDLLWRGLPDYERERGHSRNAAV